MLSSLKLPHLKVIDEKRVNPGLYAGLLNDPIKYIDADGRDESYWPPGNNAYTGGLISPDMNQSGSDSDVYTGGTQRIPGVNAPSTGAISPDPDPPIPDPSFFTPFISPDGFFSFRYYANWGGPGWTGGWRGSWDTLRLDQLQHLRLPQDAEDECYMWHDRCHGECRQVHKCSGRNQAFCFNTCDLRLSWCLLTHQDRNSWYSIRRYIGVYYFVYQTLFRTLVN